MAKSPHRDPAKHSKKDPAKPTRAKAARPDAPVLDHSLADLLNPAIGQGRAGDRRADGPPLPPPLWGRVGWGVGRGSRNRRRAHKRNCPRVRITSRPPPLSPPHKGEGKSKRQSLNSRPIIPGTAAPTLPMRIAHAPRRAVLASRRSSAMSAKRRSAPRRARSRSGQSARHRGAGRRQRFTWRHQIWRREPAAPDAIPAPRGRSGRIRQRREPAIARQIAARGPRRISRSLMDAAPPAAAG